MMRLSMALLIALAASSAAHAANEFEILSAQNVPGLKPGDKLSKGAPVTMPLGGRISFIDRSAGSVVMRECAGAYNGPIESCTAGQASGQPKVVPGATRGAVR